ncbi:uncharacterized protein BXZ73DRAFT_19208, partial [Epithele typhae]|uniref:uncharacterized protein n=1 Tax=Epithele typhae TaxID=378194 RepID=UPI0020086A65
CPHCNYTSHRKPDLRRHVDTHTGGSTPMRWICGGVPLAEARKRGINVERMHVYLLDGQERVGGCLKAFSRRDAMLRHWRTTGGRCI